MIQKLPTYTDAQKAICGGKDPIAFLHLGILYAQGIGTEQNDILASYFIKKAIDMGCKEAEEYIKSEYESGKKDFAQEIITAFEDERQITQENTAKLRTKVEVERKAKHYGRLSQIRKYLPLLYPEYNREKAINDILNGHDTLDADILFSTCTTDNTSEIYLNSQAMLLQQIYAPFEKYDMENEDLDAELLGKDESELAQCLVNLTESYDIICQLYHVPKKEIFNLQTLKLFPYIKVIDLALLRQQGFRCLLSIKDIDPAISKNYLHNLSDDKALLDVCENIRDQDLQLFLISFVELNIDLDALEIDSLQLLRAYRSDNFVPLAAHLNAFAKRLTRHGIKHELPAFTEENLPQIDMRSQG